MKRRIIYFYMLLVMIACNACSQKEVPYEKESVNLETDDYLCTSDLKGLAKTEKGYYYWKEDLLYFFDANSKKDTVVCSNSNCSHDAAGCNAYYHDHSDSIFYYQKNLYLIQENIKNDNTIDFNLIKVSEDGSQRTNLLTLFQGKVKTDIGFNAIIHRGYCYFYQHNFDTEKEIENTLYRVALKQNAKPEEVMSVQGYGVSYEMLGYKQNLYVEISMFSDSACTELLDSLKSYQIETGEIKDCNLSDFRSLYAVDDVLYYVKDNAIWKKEEEKEPEQFYHLGEDVFGKLWFDGNYFYFDNLADCQIKGKDASERKILVLSAKGKKVDEFTMKYQYEFLGGDSERLFWMDYYTLEKILVFDTKQIGTDTHNLVELEG